MGIAWGCVGCSRLYGSVRGVGGCVGCRGLYGAVWDCMGLWGCRWMCVLYGMYGGVGV